MKKIFLIALVFCNFAFAGETKFHAAIDSGFVSGQFICTEINQYGSLNYACGGKDSDGTIRSVQAKSVITFPSTFFTPYHKNLQTTVYIHTFIGQIQNNGETMVNCSFPDYQITAKTNYTITLTNNGCSVLPQN